MPLTKPYKGENKEDAEKRIARNKLGLELTQKPWIKLTKRDADEGKRLYVAKGKKHGRKVAGKVGEAVGGKVGELNWNIIEARQKALIRKLQDPKKAKKYREKMKKRSDRWFREELKER